MGGTRCVHRQHRLKSGSFCDGILRDCCLAHPPRASFARHQFRECLPGSLHAVRCALYFLHLPILIAVLFVRVWRADPAQFGDAGAAGPVKLLRLQARRKRAAPQRGAGLATPMSMFFGILIPGEEQGTSPETISVLRLVLWDGGGSLRTLVPSEVVP